MREMLDEKIALALSSAARYTAAMKQNRFQFPADFSCLGNLASLPTTSQSPQNLASRLGQHPVQNHQQGRKRRRGEVANPANTLDGLVARRADDIGAADSLIKRYLTENEAIESPSDDQELKRIETDPDVSTRTCSICGYQGKWVSEMIRHKRVHTNERPFKCKYCSRTSKWKADLIRHVAKTHGIRVVSKYSRSKTFDASATGLHELKDNKPEVLQAQPNITTHTINIKPLPTSVITSAPPKTEGAPESSQNTEDKSKQERLPVAYRCVLCFFEQESILVLMSHLRNVHNAAPYECHVCNECFVDAQTAMAHFTETSKCSRTDLLVNIAPIYATQQKLSPLSLLGATAGNSTQELLRRLMTPVPNTTLLPFLNQLQMTAALTNFRNSLAAPPSDVSSLDSGITEDFEEQRSESCDKCPYKGDGDSFLAHKKGHAIPKGLLNYKCAFCDWFGKKKSAVEEHMKVHTENPHLYMSEVEKNLITPVTLAKYNSEAESSSHLQQSSSSSSMNASPSSSRSPEQVTISTPTNATYDLAAALFALKQRADIATLLPLQALGALNPSSASPVLQTAFSPLSTALAQMSPSSPEEVSTGSQSASPKLSPSGLTMFSSSDLPLKNPLKVAIRSPPAEDAYEPHSPTNSTASSEETDSTKAADKQVCIKCNASFSETAQLEHHSKFHASNLEYECPICDYAVSAPADLSKHLINHHNISEDQINELLQKGDDDEIVDVENVEAAGSSRK